MSTIAKNTGLILLGAVIGAAGLGAVFVNDGNEDRTTGAAVSVSETAAATSNEPLYWVAPMDANYRRDKPGKSPMGMDLVPVYPEADSAIDSGPGTIKISPEVINNLGVRTATSSMNRMHFEIRTVGYVGYNEDEIVHVHPRVEGWVEKLYIKAEGDPVTRDQPLYDLYSPALVNAQEEYLFAFSRGNRELIRGAESRLRALQFPSHALEKLKKSRQVNQTVTFYAAQSGVVDNLNLRQGMFVKPGMTLMSIGALDEVWVEAEVFERQAGMITAGLPVSLRLDFLPGAKREGVVDYVYPALDPKTRTLKVRMRFDNHDGKLKPNMFAEVVIFKDDADTSLTVPNDAIIRGADSNRVVLALGDGRFKSITVKTGRTDGKQVEIIEGINAGEEVVTSAQFLLDSESGKTSDFKRMHVDSPMDSNDMSMDGMSMDGMSMDGMNMDDLNMDKISLDSMNPEASDMKMMPQDESSTPANSKTLKQGQTGPVTPSSQMISQWQPESAGVVL